MKILISAFESFGIRKLLRKENITKEILREIKSEFPARTIILPVREEAQEILKALISFYKPDAIILLGEDQNPFLSFKSRIRIEMSAHKGLETLKSNLAPLLLAKYGWTNQNIGDYFCNRVYYEALKLNKNSVFIHIFPSSKYKALKLIRKIIKFLLKYEKI